MLNGFEWVEWYLGLCVCVHMDFLQVLLFPPSVQKQGYLSWLKLHN